MASKWEEFRPSKTLWIWSCIGSAVATVVVGFAAGGWVTGGTATKMATSARDDGRAELAATVCVERFKNGEDFATALTNLKAKSSWTRDDFVTEGGWATLAGMTDPVAGSAELCAEALAKMDPPAAAAGTGGKISG